MAGSRILDDGQPENLRGNKTKAAAKKINPFSKNESPVVTHFLREIQPCRVTLSVAINGNITTQIIRIPAPLPVTSFAMPIGTRYRVKNGSRYRWHFSNRFYHRKRQETSPCRYFYDAFSVGYPRPHFWPFFLGSTKTIPRNFFVKFGILADF